jgi:Spy/CpxP family protein refolding chaperone
MVKGKRQASDLRIVSMGTAGRARCAPACRTAAVLVLLGMWVAAADAGQQRWKWWQAPQVQRDLGLASDQVTRIDQVFTETWPALHRAKIDLDTLEQELSALIASADADEAQVARQIDRVEAARADLGRTRSMMLYRMYRALTPDQRVTLKALHEQWDRERQLGAQGR